MLSKFVRKTLAEKHIKPLTDEWFKTREKITTGTQTARVLGYESINKSSQGSIDSPFTQRALNWGTTHEDLAIKLFERITKLKVFEVGLKIHPLYRFLGATPDGLVEDDSILEIKCPLTRSIWGPIPFEYWIQMQIEMEVFGANKAYFFQVEYPEGRYRLKVIYRDRVWFKEVLPKIRNYWSSPQRSRKRKRSTHYVQFSNIEAILYNDDLTSYIQSNNVEMSIYPTRIFNYNRSIEDKNRTIENLLGRRLRNAKKIIPHLCKTTIEESYEAIQSGVDCINPIFTRNGLIATIPLFMKNTCYHYLKSKGGVLKLMKKIAFVDYVVNSSYSHKIVYYDGSIEDVNIDKVQSLHVDIESAIQSYGRMINLPIERAVQILPMNMKIRQPRWDSVRSKIANERGELSLVWGVSNAMKRKMYGEGIERISEINLAEIECKNTQSLIKTNQSIPTNWMECVEQIRSNWDKIGVRGAPAATCYIDFETANNIIFMIGIILDSKYYEFTASTLDREGEAAILKQFEAFDRLNQDAVYVHWSRAERSNLKTHLKHKNNHYIQKLNENDSKWFDLANIFKNNALVLPGMNSFKLKSVVCSMHKLGLISTSYDPSTLSCMNGAEASSYGLAYYDKEYDNMKAIVEYNKIDCQVLMDIVNYLKKT
jgi:putative phage-type endonuclease